MLDESPVVVAVYARWVREFGGPVEEAVGLAYFDVHPQAAQWLGVFEKGLAGETVRAERIRVLTDGEGAHLIDASLLPRRNARGEVIGLLLISTPTAFAHDSVVARADEERLSKALARLADAIPEASRRRAAGSHHASGSPAKRRSREDATLLGQEHATESEKRLGGPRRLVQWTTVLCPASSSVESVRLSAGAEPAKDRPP